VLPRWLLKAVAVAYVVAVLALTTGDQPPGRFDIVGNIVLFVPLGALVMLRWPRLHPVWVVAAGFVASGAIEAAQLTVLAGRDATLNDVALNTSGTALGWVAGRTVADLLALARR
jgi:glycopeptide antibiotics resistance protein